MLNRVIVDSGPLVALFDRDDRYHEQAVDFLKQLRGEAVSNLAVVTEVAYLLDFSPQAQWDFLGWVAAGALRLVELQQTDLVRVVELSQKYADLPMDFADASLVALAERLGIRKVASVDRDFSIYRYKGRHRFQNVFYELA